MHAVSVIRVAFPFQEDKSAERCNIRRVLADELVFSRGTDISGDEPNMNMVAMEFGQDWVLVTSMRSRASFNSNWSKKEETSSRTSAANSGDLIR
ncbi:MAG: hypothetical protein AAGG44_09315, partial [Planctomycetota bacterium]